MSVRAMASAAVAKRTPTSSVLREQPSTARSGEQADDLLAQLTKYIPTEIVAAYTAVVGVLPVDAAQRSCGGDFTARWVALGAFALLTPATVQTVYVIKRRAANNIGPQVATFELSVALIAFLAWAALLPLTPLSTWCWWKPSYGTAVGLTVLLLIGLAGRLHDTPKPSG
jgi:hypothetical protein